MSLTIKQSNIREYMLKRQRMRYPTVREVAKHFKISPSTAQQHIAALRKKNALATPSKSRSGSEAR